MQILDFNSLEKRPEAAAPFHVTELSERLAGPDGFMVKKQALARLGELIPQVEARLRMGLARDAYREAEMLKSALRAAQRFVEDYPVQTPKLV